MNLLTEGVLRCVLRAGETALSLPEVFSACVRDDILSFSALRPHQRHAWHAFLSQTGALALIKAGLAHAPDDPEAWRAMLRALTPGYTDDAPWCLIAPLDRPAFMQPPIPSGRLTDLKNTLASPDRLDMLVTAKNHDLKTEVMACAAPDDWIFALVTLQTMEGFLGQGNYGISRMNGGFANRAGVGLAPPGGPGAHVRRDMERLVTIRDEMPGREVYARKGGLRLVWLRPWDGSDSIPPAELAPLYVEICRRVRLVNDGGRVVARAGSSSAPRIVPLPGGVTGDPWSPFKTDQDGSVTALTVDARGFDYRRMVDIIVGARGIRPAPLQVISETDPDQGLSIIARAFVRGKGKTEGYHERCVPLSKKAKRLFGSPVQLDRIADIARARVEEAALMSSKVLRPALMALFQNGPDVIDFSEKSALARASQAKADAFVARFQEQVDRGFFPALWEEAEANDPKSARASRTTWLRDLKDAALALLQEADASAPKSSRRRYRAVARAQGVFRGSLRKNFPVLVEENSSVAA